MNSELIKRIVSSVILIPLSIFIIIKGSILFLIFLILCFFVCVYEWYKMVNQISILLIGFLYLILSFISVYMIREDLNLNYFFLLFILCICVATDIGGYIFGKIFKGPKLTKISPNKTYSGVLGSYIFAMISALVILNIKFLHLPFDLTLNLAILIFSISTVSQLGDLVVSYFKRFFNVKDTGNIIPGHGGLLDRLDGMLFAFPFSYVVISFDILDIYK